jgi:hypothetical protein
LVKSFSLVLFVSLTNIASAIADEDDLPDCGFGYGIDYRDLSCYPFTWDYEEEDDGFVKYFSISMDPDSEFSSGSASIQIFCDKKKIEVYVWTEYANSFGWTGTGEFKIDNLAPKKISYRLQKDFEGVMLSNSKSFMSELVKAKEKFAVKIPKVGGYDVMVYPKANLMEYRKKFSSAGCKF